MKNQKYTLCVDLGNQCTKYTLLINGSSNLDTLFKIPSVFKKDDNATDSISNFISLLSTKTYINYVKENNFYGNNIIPSKNGFIKVEYLDRIYYPEELVAKLLETTKYIVEDKLNTDEFVQNIILTKDIPLVTAIAGFHLVDNIPEETAILYAYKEFYASRSLKKNSNLLVIDLGASALKTHYYQNLKHVRSKSFTDWSANEFTTVLHNLSIRKCLQKFPNLSNEEKSKIFNKTKEAFAIFPSDKSFTFEHKFESTNVHYKYEVDNDGCTKQVINRMIYRIKQVDNDIDATVNEILLVGGAAKIPGVKNAFKKFFKAEVIDMNIDPEFVITYGLSIYFKNKLLD